MKNKYLLIDGNYFAQRCIGILNQGDRKNNLITEEEKQEFLQALDLQLIKLWEVFSKHCKNFIFVSDSYSWRKSLEPFKPFYYSEEDLQTVKLGYKEQRIEMKEKSDIDYTMFYELFNQFVTKLSNLENTYNSEGLEGDDLLNILSKKLTEKDLESCIFSTDKDLIQLLSTNCYIFRNTKSKQAPNGTFELSLGTAKKYLVGSDNLQGMLLKQNTDTMAFKDLMGIDIFDANNSITRNLNNGIEIGQKYALIVNKIICGDKSDNIFPIIRWKNGTKWFSVTELKIKKAMDLSNIVDSEQGYFDILVSETKNPPLFKNFITNLIRVCDKVTTTFDVVYEHYKRNMKLILLSEKYIPTNYMEEFNKKYDNIYLNNITEKSMSIGDLKQGLGYRPDEIVQITDRATNILKDSIIEL